MAQSTRAGSTRTASTEALAAACRAHPWRAGAGGAGASYYVRKDESLISAARHTTLLPLVMAGDYQAASREIDQVLAVTGAADRDPGVDVLQDGPARPGQDL